MTITATPSRVRAYMHTPERMAMFAQETRQAHGWTVDEVANRAGVPVDVVISVESGQPKRINLGQVRAVFDTLGVTVLLLPASLTGV